MRTARKTTWFCLCLAKTNLYFVAFVNTSPANLDLKGLLQTGSDFCEMHCEEHPHLCTSSTRFSSVPVCSAATRS